jgi:lipopolysaccharide/colanic/teichoic acid biosynthesis glycosyltransferase
MALEQIAAKKAELRSMMQLYGRGGMYNDFVRFQAEQRKKRQEAIEDQRKRRQRLVHGVLATIAIIVTGSIMLAVLIALRGTMR